MDGRFDGQDVTSGRRGVRRLDSQSTSSPSHQGYFRRSGPGGLGGSPRVGRSPRRLGALTGVPSDC